MKNLIEILKESLSKNIDIRKLNDLCSTLNEKYYVNEGGCIYLAYLISKQLNKMKINYTVNEYYDENDEPFHISLVVNNVEINPAENTYNGYIKNLGKLTTKDLLKYNKENEDTMSFFWKQSFKQKIRNEIDEFFK